ncbi:hypothetical protein [Paenibacillus sp. EPM92]|nr:hypothetical protein [Paenibacillus sp. EPM92]
MKQPVYKFFYTVDNRIKAVRVTEEEPAEESGAWFIVAAGAACVIWWFLW